MSKIGILHPGEMGVSVAASAINSGYEVYWLSKGRGKRTRVRAEKYGLIEIDSLFQFCQTCELIVSVCPPHAAEEVARSVLDADFKGLYLDANAISPQHTIKIGHMLEANGIHFVDGGIIGGPAWTLDQTWLYLSGKHANAIVSCFSHGPLETEIIGDEIGKASGLKMCYAAYAKGTTALLSGILALAESLGVRDNLYHHWARDEPNFPEQVDQRSIHVTAKAWRFEGEMKEIASTFRAAGLPDDFHLAAAEIYHRMVSFKDANIPPSLNEVLQALLSRET